MRRPDSPKAMEKGLEDLGGGKWGRGWAWGAPPPEMLMMEPGHLGPCFGLEEMEVVSEGEGVEAGLSYPKSIAWSGLDVSL